MSLIDGDVLMNTEDTQDWVPAAGNTPLGEADRIWVADGGKSELKMRYGAVIRLNSRTAFEVVAIEADGLQFSMDLGEAYVHVEELNGEALAIVTPAGTILPDRKSSFRIDVDETGQVALSVLDGMVRIDRPQRDLEVSANQRLILRHDGGQPQLTALKPPDTWDAWNRRRDQEQFAIEYSDSRQYLPEELRSYAADFDHNGRWIETPDYGLVWTPTVVVAGDWSPYRSGRWVWMRGAYVWISSEPWGWAPHHYGRWTFVRPFGWCWVPPERRQTYWGPGYVGWVHSDSAISWVPLAPREMYYGHGFHGPYSVDVSEFQGKIPKDHSPRTYRNVRFANAVTAVHRETFLTGKAINLKTRPNPFLDKRAIHTPPVIRPVRATTMPGTREIRRSELPPKYVFTRKQAKAGGVLPESSRPLSTGPDKTPARAAVPIDRSNNKGNSFGKDDGRRPTGHLVAPSQPIQRGRALTGKQPGREPPKAERKPSQPTIYDVRKNGSDIGSKPSLPPDISPQKKNSLSSPARTQEDAYDTRDRGIAKSASPPGPSLTVIPKKIAESQSKRITPPSSPSIASGVPVSHSSQRMNHKGSGPGAAPGMDLNKPYKQGQGKTQPERDPKDGDHNKQGQRNKDGKQGMAGTSRPVDERR